MEIPRSVSHGLKKEPTSWDAHPSGQRQYLIVFGDLPERRKVGFHWHWMDAQKGYSAIHQYDLETILVELTIFSPYFTELKYQMLVLFLHQSPFLVWNCGTWPCDMRYLQRVWWTTLFLGIENPMRKRPTAKCCLKLPVISRPNSSHSGTIDAELWN